MTYQSKKPKHADGSRDKNGRFRKGVSGNRNGRPPKRPPPPWSLQRSFAEALAEEVSVKNPNGTAQSMPMAQLLVKDAIQSSLKAKPKDKIHIILALKKDGLLDHLGTEAFDESGEVFTEEDRRLLEIISREISADLNLERPGIHARAEPEYSLSPREGSA